MLSCHVVDFSGNHGIMAQGKPCGRDFPPLRTQILFCIDGMRVLILLFCLFDVIDILAGQSESVVGGEGRRRGG